MTKTKQFFNTMIFTSLFLITIFMFAACDSNQKSGGGNGVINIKSGINFSQPYASYQTKTYSNKDSVVNYIQSVTEENIIPNDKIADAKNNIITNECITYLITCSYTKTADSDDYIKNFIKKYTDKYNTTEWTQVYSTLAWYKTTQNYDVMIIVDKQISDNKFIIKISSFRFNEGSIDELLNGTED